jgi:hypothetical protein
MKKHYKTSNLDEGGYVAPKGVTNLTKDYREHKLAQGVVLMPASLGTASRNTLIRIIRDQASLIAELRTKG